MARKPEELVAENELSHMLRNDKKSQQTHLVAQIAAVMPNGRQFTASEVSYGTVLIPEKSFVANVYSICTEPFDKGATFNVGTAANPTAFCTDIAGSAITGTLADVINHNTYYPVDTEVFVTPTYAGDNTKGEISFVFELYELEASIGRHTR